MADDLTQSFPASSGARLHVTLTDGRVFHAQIKSSPGHSDNPFTLEELLTKFRRFAQGRCETGASEKFLQASLKLEHAGNIRDVMAGFPLVKP